MNWFDVGHATTARRNVEGPRHRQAHRRVEYSVHNVAKARAASLRPVPPATRLTVIA
jgi:hypothetical protein